MFEASNYLLTPTSPLNGATSAWQSLSIAERSLSGLLSITQYKENSDTFSHVFENIFGALPPMPGKLHDVKDGVAFWTAPGQWFVEYADQGGTTDRAVAQIFGSCAAVTLQTDAWAQIAISGDGAQAFFERLIPLDLSQNAFPPGSAARTQAEHISVFVLHCDTAQYRLLCPRSYAQSFFTAVERTATSVFGAPTAS